MSTRFDAKDAVDFKNAAFAVISGAIAGITPKVGGWVRVKNADTVSYDLSTTGTVNGVWTAAIATDYLGANAIALDPSLVNPAFPVGVASSGTSVLTIPDRRYTHVQLTFTPSAGAGNANANSGIVIGRPVDIKHHDRGVAAFFFVPTTDTQAGNWALEYSPKLYDRDPGKLMPLPTIDNLVDLPPWAAAVDSSNTAIAIASPAGAGQSLPKRLGLLEFAAVRAKYTPTSGFGRAQCVICEKG